VSAFPYRLSWLVPALASIVLPAAAADTLVIIGTHSSGPGRGFSLAHFAAENGALTQPRFDGEAVAPSFFVVAADGRHLYACNSVRRGGLSAYAIDARSGRIDLLNRVDSGGAEPCYVSLDQTGRYALITNYDSGSVAVFALQPDGRVGARTAFEVHAGRGADPARQTRAHPHSIVVDPGNRFALAADLGADRIYIYRFNAKTGSLAPNDPPFAATPPGFGPRHLKFHPNGRWAYVTGEIENAVIGFHWDSNRGILSRFQSVSTLPPGFRGPNTAAEIVIHPTGKFLYVSNRGANTLAAFSIDPDTGRLAMIESVSSHGRMPRNMALDPAGRWLLATNYEGDNAAVFRIDARTGVLTLAGPPVSVRSPFGVRFLAVR
jgi:6-phosphogluconolactonase